MPKLSQKPAYNLKAVMQETGLNADVLRAWERRYGLPVPHRTPGGHRLYSDHDIATLKWLKARQDEGLRISQAVELWKESIDSGHDPLVEYSPKIVTPANVFLSGNDTRIDTLRQNWLEASLEFNEIEAEEILNQAFALYQVESVCFQILLYGLRHIGEKWYAGEATVQQEHFISEMAIRRLESLIAATPRPTRPQTVLVGCPSDEWHTFPVLLLSLLLHRRGLEVIYLGASVPFERLEETARAVQPDLIVLAAQQLTTAATLQSTALALQSHGSTIAYGGLIFNRVPKIREHIPAHFLGENLEGAIRLIEQLLSAYTPLPTAIRVDESYRDLASLHREKHTLIEMALCENLQAAHMPTEYINMANAFFWSELTAALELGDPTYLEADLEWVKNLLTGHNISEDRLLPYLVAYGHAVRKVMGESSAPITHWIDSYTMRHEPTH
jgi:DNA-binding transcriptional MerR regulator